MTKINVDDVRTKFFERTGRKIGEDDPVLDVVILNQIIVEASAAAFAAGLQRHIESATIILNRSAAEMRHALDNLMREQSASIAAHRQAINESEYSATARIQAFQKEVVIAIEALLDERTRQAIAVVRGESR